MNCANRGHLETAELLLNAGASVTDPMADGGDRVYTDNGEVHHIPLPAFLAIFNHHPDILALFLSHGQDPNALSHPPTSRTLLHAAAACGHLDLVLLLIDAGADIHALDADGQTPLSRAQAGRHPRHKQVVAHLTDLQSSCQP